MRGNNIMNKSYLAYKGWARKASEVKQKWSNFHTKMFGLALYLRSPAPATPIKGGLNDPAYEMRRKDKSKRRGRERERRNKMRTKLHNNNNNNNNNNAHTCSHRDPCAMTFRECKNLAVLDC